MVTIGLLPVVRQAISWTNVDMLSVNPLEYYLLWSNSRENQKSLADATSVLRMVAEISSKSLQWWHNERDGISNHLRLDWLLNRLFRRRSNKAKLRVTGLCEGNPPVTGGLPSQRASNAEGVSIWWHHHVPFVLQKEWNNRGTWLSYTRNIH